MPLSANVLSVTELVKAYGEIVAVDGISFDVGPNEIVGLLGPNGAGKTTTINMILGVLKPDSGRISVEGVDIAAHRSQGLQRANFAAVYAPLPGNLTVQQNLRVFGLLYRVKNLADRIATVLQQFDLEKYRDVKCGVLSSGEQTRVSLAKRCSILRNFYYWTSRRRRSILPSHVTFVPRSKILPYRARGGCYGPHTTCTRWKTSATAYSSSREEEFCWKVTRRPCRASMAKGRWKSFSSVSLANRLHLKVE